VRFSYCVNDGCCEELDRCGTAMGRLADQNGCSFYFGYVARCIEAQPGADWSTVTSEQIASCFRDARVEAQGLLVPFPEAEWSMFEPEFVRAFECVLAAPATVPVRNEAGEIVGKTQGDCGFDDAGCDPDAGGNANLRPGGCFERCAIGRR
jgi:hypothetical protein